MAANILTDDVKVLGLNMAKTCLNCTEWALNEPGISMRPLQQGFFAPSVVGECSFIGHKPRFAAKA